MGKSQSKPDVALVEPMPLAYDLDRATHRPLSPEHRIVVLQSTEELDRPHRRQRSQSLSLPDRKMSSKWKSASSRKDILDRKAYFMGRFQAKSITEANLIELRRNIINNGKRRKTRIKMSPLGFSFGTKPGGLLNTDKVPYQFVPLEDIETLRLDGVLREILLCVFRIDHNRSNVPNGTLELPTVQHFEINAFHIDPREGVLFQRAHNDFITKGPVFQQFGNGEMKARSVSHGHITDDDDDRWKTSRLNNNTMLTAPSRSEFDVRKRQTNTETYHHVSSPDYTDSTSSFVYSGDPSYGYHHQAKTYDVALGPRYHSDARSVLTHKSGSSITRRVYFNRDLPVADVETQVSAELNVPDSASSSNEASTSNFRGRTSSHSSQKSNGFKNKDSVKRRIRDLSREMDQLRTMMDDDENENTLRMPHRNGINNIEEERSSTSSEDTMMATRSNRHPSSVYEQHGHAGTIDTRMGKVDVMVDSAPVYNTSHRDGYVSESQMVTHNDRVRRRTSERSGTGSEIGGRYVYYRPVLTQPTSTYQRAQVVRPRSVEPSTKRKKGWLR